MSKQSFFDEMSKSRFFVKKKSKKSVFGHKPRKISKKWIFGQNPGWKKWAEPTPATPAP